MSNLNSRIGRFWRVLWCWAFVHNLHSKIGTSGTRSDFRKFLKKSISPEVFNMVFRNNSSKGIFGDIISNLKKLKLSGDSRWLQKVALKSSGACLCQEISLDSYPKAAPGETKVPEWRTNGRASANGFCDSWRVIVLWIKIRARGCSCRRTKMAQFRSMTSVFYSFHCAYWFDNRLQFLLTRVPIFHLETAWLPIIEMGFCSPDNGMATFHIQPSMDILYINFQVHTRF